MRKLGLLGGLLAAGLVGTLALTGPAEAQWSMPFQCWACGITYPMVMNPCQEGSSCAPKNGSGSAGTAKGQIQRPVRPVATTFRIDPAVSERVHAAFLQTLERSMDPAKAQQLDAAMARMGVWQTWQRAAAKDGLRADDMADAMAEYWVTNWQMANRAQATPAGAPQAVRRQMLESFGAAEKAGTLTEAQRQAIAETYVYRMMLGSLAYEGAVQQHNPEQTAKMSDAAEMHFQQDLHVDLRALNLTAQGFVRRG